MDPQPPFFRRLHLPELFALAIGPTGHLSRRFGVDSALLAYYDHPLVRAQLLPKEKTGAKVVSLGSKRTHGAA